MFSTELSISQSLAPLHPRIHLFHCLISLWRFLLFLPILQAPGTYLPTYLPKLWALGSPTATISRYPVTGTWDSRLHPVPEMAPPVDARAQDRHEVTTLANYPQPSVPFLVLPLPSDISVAACGQLSPRPVPASPIPLPTSFLRFCSLPLLTDRAHTATWMPLD